MARRNTALGLSLQYPDIEEIRREFRKLPNTLASKYMEPAMKKAIQPGLRKLREITPRGPTSNLKKSVRSKTKKYVKDGTAIGLVGYTVGKKAKGYHQGFLEFGTKERQTKGRFASSLRWPKGDPRGAFEIINKYSKVTQGRKAGARADRTAARAAKLFVASLGTSTRARQLATKATAQRSKAAALTAAGRKLTTKPKSPKAFFKSAPAGERVQLGRMRIGGRFGRPPVKTAYEASKNEMVGVLREQLAVQLELAAIANIQGPAKRARRRRS